VEGKRARSERIRSNPSLGARPKKGSFCGKLIVLGQRRKGSKGKRGLAAFAKGKGQ